MKKVFLISLLAVAGLFAGTARAADETALATSKGCMACHQVAAKVVGPAYKDVAKKYTTKDTDKLVRKVLEGGSGAWGSVPMPAGKASGLTDAEARRLVTWILSFR
jgi:cytochrome c